jgi:hypothetical protein
MSYVRRIALFVAAGLTFALGACSDGSSPSSPLPPEASQGLLDGLLGGGGSGGGSSNTVDVLTRKTALTSDEVASARVSLLGAVLVLPRSGLTVVVPPLAAPLGTRITVTAPKGNLVGYHFEPSGMKFRLPLVLTQDLTKTNSTGLLDPLVGAYFKGELKPQVTALELLKLKLLNLVAILNVTHFSGYVIATD